MARGGLNPFKYDVANYVLPVSPSDVVDLPAGVFALFVGGTGDVRLTVWGDPAEVIQYTGLAANTFLDKLSVKQVRATGTTANEILAYIKREEP